MQLLNTDLTHKQWVFYSTGFVTNVAYKKVIVSIKDIDGWLIERHMIESDLVTNIRISIFDIYHGHLTLTF